MVGVAPPVERLSGPSLVAARAAAIGALIGAAAGTGGAGSPAIVTSP